MDRRNLINILRQRAQIAKEFAPRTHSWSDYADHEEVGREEGKIATLEELADELENGEFGD